jgi:hypothetical protein
MNSFDEHFDLISLMVEETFKGHDSVEAPIEIFSSLSLEKSVIKNESLQVPVQLEFMFDSFLGALDVERGCYIFMVKDIILELPMNWGPFRFVANETNYCGKLFELQSHEDVDCLIEVIENHLNISIQSLSCFSFGDHLKLSYQACEPSQLADVLPFNKPNTKKAA